MVPINAANESKDCSSMDNCKGNYMDNMSVAWDIQDIPGRQEQASCHPPIPGYSLPGNP